MDLYLFSISGKLLVPAKNKDDAKNVAAQHTLHLQMALNHSGKIQGDVLAGVVKVGLNPTELDVDEKTARRMVAQEELPLEDPKPTARKKKDKEII